MVESTLGLPYNSTSFYFDSTARVRRLGRDKHQQVAAATGVTVLVKGEATAVSSLDGPNPVERLYVIPRPGSGTTILGGTMQEDVWDEHPDPAQTERMLKGNARLCSELLTGDDGGFEVISVQCGLRPARKGGARVENEIISDGGGRRDIVVTHAYGHSGLHT